MKTRTSLILVCLLITTGLTRNVHVSTILQLENAAVNALSGDTILIADGTYMISSFGITVRTNNVVFKSESGNRNDVIISGDGMNGVIQYVFWISANNITIQSVTMQKVFYHLVKTDVNNDGIKVIDCVLKDANEQFIKIPASEAVTDPSENGVVENCLFDFTAGIANQYYTGGVDCHKGKNWIIRNNTFKNIRSPDNNCCEHAVHFWNGSEGTLVENNVIINCDRGIGFGLGDSKHLGGTIRNNMIFHKSYTTHDMGDVGIGLESANNVSVYNNTIFFENSYPNAIEYRFTATTGAKIFNNLTNKAIRLRDGASGNVANNINNAVASWFKDVTTGNLHLANGLLTNVIDKGSNVSELTFDIDGDERPQGAEIDIGADEFTTTSVKFNKIPVPIHRNTSTYHLTISTMPGLNSQKCKDNVVNVNLEGKIISKQQ
jgi:hypothetical protein